MGKMLLQFFDMNVFVRFIGKLVRCQIPLAGVNRLDVVSVCEREARFKVPSS